MSIYSCIRQTNNHIVWSKAYQITVNFLPGSADGAVVDLCRKFIEMIVSDEFAPKDIIHHNLYYGSERAWRAYDGTYNPRSIFQKFSDA